jgi:hypothetical protein
MITIHPHYHAEGRVQKGYVECSITAASNSQTLGTEQKVV